MAGAKDTMKTAEPLLDEYYERFGDSFPTFVNPDQPVEDLIAQIRSCLDSGEPFEYEISENILY